jgi:hypothetical protein
MANGTMVALKSLEEQKKGINKMFIDDLKRQPHGYETAFEGEQYHLVRNRETSQFKIEVNQRMVGDPGPSPRQQDIKFMPFTQTSGRKNKHLMN